MGGRESVGRLAGVTSRAMVHGPWWVTGEGPADLVGCFQLPVGLSMGMENWRSCGPVERYGQERKKSG